MHDSPAIDPATGWDLDRRIGSLPTLRTLDRMSVPFILLTPFVPAPWFWVAASLAALWSGSLALAYGMHARALRSAQGHDGASARQLRIELAILAIVGGLIMGLGASLLGLLEKTVFDLATWQRVPSAFAGALGLLATLRGAWLLRTAGA